MQGIYTLRCYLPISSSISIISGAGRASPVLSVPKHIPDYGMASHAGESTDSRESSFCLGLEACGTSSAFSCVGIVTGHEASVNLRVPRGSPCKQMALEPLEHLSTQPQRVSSG